MNAEGERSPLEFKPADRVLGEFAHVFDCWHGKSNPAATAHDGLIANQILATTTIHFGNHVSGVGLGFISGLDPAGIAGCGALDGSSALTVAPP